MGDQLFSYAPEFGPPFSKVTRSDLCRLRAIRYFLSQGWERVVWIDSDVLIWNAADFTLPEVGTGEVICARESFFHHDGRCALQVNNSIVGFTDPDAVQKLIECSVERLNAALRANHPARMTVIGTDLFSELRFPLRRVFTKQAGCFSETTINRLLGPWLSGRDHLRSLSRASGATLCAANLCSSREHDRSRMDRLVFELISGPTFALTKTEAALTPLYRAYLAASHLPYRVRCWLMSRARELRAATSGNT